MIVERILVATTNGGKEREIRRMLDGLGVGVVGLGEFPWVPEHEEIGETFAANAAGKAIFYHRITGLPTLADDSGLMVDLLDGGPGVHSARFVGPGGTDASRIRGLLAALRRAGGTPRTARFVCSLAFAAEGRIALAVEGVCEGEIAKSPRGAHGFGFDPVFVVPSLGKTFAELRRTKKTPSATAPAPWRPSRSNSRSSSPPGTDSPSPAQLPIFHRLWSIVHGPPLVPGHRSPLRHPSADRLLDLPTMKLDNFRPADTLPRLLGSLAMDGA